MYMVRRDQNEYKSMKKHTVQHITSLLKPYDTSECETVIPFGYTCYYILICQLIKKNKK